MPRKIVPFLVVAVLGAAWALCTSRGDPLAAQPASPGREKLPRLLAAKPLEEAGERDELRRLMRARYNAALEEARQRYQLFRGGTARLEQTLDAFRRLLASGVATADTGKERVEFLERYVDLTRGVARMAESIAKSGQGHGADAAQARYMYLDAQIQLMSAQRRLAGPPGVKGP
jgi:hypothetical protein